MADQQPIGELSQRTARITAIRAVSEVAGKVATLAWTIAAARMLSTDDFGAVSYAMALMLLLSSFTSWGFDSGLIRRGSAEPDHLPRLYLASQVEKTALGVLAFGAAALIATWTRPSVESWLVLALVLVAGFPEQWSHTARELAAVRQVVAGISTALVLQRVVTAIVILGALVADTGPVGVAAGFLVGTVIGWGAHVVVVRRLDVGTRFRELERQDLVLAMRGTFLLGLSSVVSMLLFRLDAVLLGLLRGDEEVAIYSVAYRLLETVLFVTYAINQAILPVLSATSSARRQRLGYERALSVGGFVYLPFLVVSILEGDAMLSLLFGDYYGEAAAPVLMFLAPAPLFFAAAFFGSSVLIAREQGRALVLSTLVALVVNTVLNLILIPPYAGAGAALATSIAYVAQTIAIVLVLRGTDDPPRFLAPLAPAAIASVVVTGFLLVIHVSVLLELGAGGVVYLVVWFLAAQRLAPEQPQIIRSLVSRTRGA